MITKTIPISLSVIKSCALNRSTPFDFKRKRMENETTKSLELRKGGQVTEEQTLGSAERKTFKRASLG